MVVDFQIIAQRRFQSVCRAETGLIEVLADAPIEVLHHAIGLRVARWNGPVFDSELLAQSVKQMLAAGFFVLAGEAVGELAAVVGEQLDDLDGTCFAHLAQEIGTAVFGPVGINFHMHPARGTVDGGA